VTLHDVATAIELEASYQMWRAQHERYWLLSRRAWLDSYTLQGFLNIEPQRDPAELQLDRQCQNRLASVGAGFASASDVAARTPKPSAS
jgi:hypothetical protein